MAKPVHWRRVWRWTRRIVLGALAFAVALVGALVILIHTDFGREIARAQIEKRLQVMFPGGATVGRLEGSPFGTLVLRDLAIHGPDGRRVIAVKTLRFGIDLLPLLSRRARLTNVVVEDADVRVERDARGELVIERLMPKVDWRIDLPYVRVRGAHVLLDAGGERFDFDALEVSGSLRSPPRRPLEATGSVTGRVRQRGVDFAIEGRVRSSDEVLEIPSATARLGGVHVLAREVRMTSPSSTSVATFAGSVSVTAPRAAVAQLVPGLDIRADVVASAEVSQGETRTYVMVNGSADGHPLVAGISVDVAAQRARGWVASDALDLDSVTGGRLRGTASASAMFDVAGTTIKEWPTGTVIVHAAGDFGNATSTRVEIAVTSSVPGVLATVFEATAPGLSASGTAEVCRVGDAIILEHGTLAARSRGVVAGSAGAISGSVNVDLTASGALAPCVEIAVKGTVAGNRLRANGVSIESLRLAIDARGLPERPQGRGELEASGIIRGNAQLGELAVSAASRADGRLAVSLRARTTAMWLAEADALVRLPRTSADALDVELQRHRIRRGSVDWAGARGHLAIRPTRIEVRDFVTVRTGGRDRIAVSGVLVPPRHLGDVAAWRRLDRRALRSGLVTLESLDLGSAAALAGLTGSHEGRLDGDLRISPSAIEGHLSLRDAIVPAAQGHGALSVEAHVSQSPAGDLVMAATAQFGRITGIEGRAALTMPRHLFDPSAWTHRTIKVASVRVAEFELDPSVLDLLGLTVDVRGRVGLTAEISEAARGGTLTVSLHQLVGLAIVQPIDAELTATIDSTDLVGKLQIQSAKRPLIEVNGTVGITAAQLIASPRRLLSAPLYVTSTLRSISAAQLLAVFGRTEVVTGTIAGDILIAGTVGRPTVRAHLTGDGLQLPRSGRRPLVDPARQLIVDVSWDGATGSVVIDATQEAGAFHLVVAGSPWALRDASATLQVRTFDMAPLLMLVPGAVGAASGQLDGKLTLTGLDPQTAKLSGGLQLSRASLPIAPTVGTLQHATIDLLVRDRDVRVTLAGELGGGTVKGNATFALPGASPIAGDVTVELREVSPIGVLEPIIDADVAIKLRQADATWIADVAVKNAHIKLPPERGQPLKPVGAPADMRFASGQHVLHRTMVRAPPAHPLLVANVVLHPMRVESEDLRSIVRGKLTVTTDGDAIGIVGAIDADRGDLDLFGRRYHVARAIVSFDGSSDPLLDVRITHDFSDVTTITTVHGRLSKPELVMSSDPATYSQGQLLGFLLGGEPHGDPATGSLKDSASGAGTSLVAARIGLYVRRALPLDLDVLRYESATATSSGSLTVGSWLTRRLFIGYRSRPAARPDENHGEGHLEYWLSRRLVLEGVGGDRGYSGVDLLWRKRY